MNTKILEINYNNPEQEKISFAARSLKEGGTVVFPTETVYGLGANALDEQAVKKIFEAKERPDDNPLITHVSSSEEVSHLVEEIPDGYKLLVDKFCPGPLTMILKKSKIVPEIVTAGLDTIAIRMPDNNIALRLISEAKVPIAAPSANISGKPSSTSAQHVINDLLGKVNVIIDGGTSSVGVESTVLDLTRDIPTILRPGGITLEQLEDVLGKVNIDSTLMNKSDNIKPLSPGMKYKHYSPNADITIVLGELGQVVENIKELSKQYKSEGKKVGVMATDQTKDSYQMEHVISLGNRNNLNQIASNLFTVLRQFDTIGVDIVLSESFNDSGVGLAIMNRLQKASGNKIIKV